MDERCNTCKFFQVSYFDEPCRTCVYSLSACVLKKDNWQAKDAKPAKPRRKELRATIERVKAERDGLIGIHDQWYRALAEKQATIDELTAERDALLDCYFQKEEPDSKGRMRVDFGKVLMEHAQELAAKDAEIAEHRRHVSEVMKREDALKKQLAAPPALLPVGTRGTIPVEIIEVEDNVYKCSGPQGGGLWVAPLHFTVLP